MLQKQKPTFWVGVDAGGTFTDFVVLSKTALSTYKVLSTPAAPEQAILQGLSEMGLLDTIPMEEASLAICHGSTIATNAALEGKGVRTAFLTNEGLEDLLLLGRQARQELYNLTPEARTSDFPDTLFLGVPTRRDAQGELITPLTDEAIAAIKSKLRDFQPESVAISLLFSYLDNSEEERLRSAIQSANAGLFVTLSGDLLPKHGEYERGVAVWLNAWLGPLVKRYLSDLKRDLPDDSHLAVMQSSGLTISADKATERAVHLLLSGPAGGVAAGAWVADRKQDPLLLTFDMGGTSTDVSLVMDSKPALTDSGKVGIYPVAASMVDIHTIGAGGGSIASVDAADMIRVGPESAGADPGPACYGNGGSEPTVTDAHLHLGYLVADRFLGGQMTLDKQAATDALTKLGKRLDMTPDHLAQGIIRIADENMTQALRVITLERGQDPRHCTLCCFGGAGGLHVCALADNLGITKAVVPAYSGVLSAFGMLVSPPGRELSDSIQRPLSEWTDADIERRFSLLKDQGIAELVAESVPADQIQSRPMLALRYKGQSHPVEVPWQSIRQVETAFKAQHLSLYGFHLDQVIELVALRLSLTGSAPDLVYPKVHEHSEVKGQKPDHHSVFGQGKVPVFERNHLNVNLVYQGAVIVVEDTATTWVSSGWSVMRDADNCLQLTRASVT